MTPAQAQQIQEEANSALSKILSKIRHRHSHVRHSEIQNLVGTPSFMWLAEHAGLDPHLLRRAFRDELKRAEDEGKITQGART